MCQLEEIHTFNRKGFPRAHLSGVVSVRMCVKAFNGCLCVSMCVWGGGAHVSRSYE